MNLERENLTAKELDAQEQLREELELKELLDNHELSGGKAEIYRKRPGQVQWLYLDTVPVSSFTLEWVKQQYGGGDYKLRLKRSNGRFFRSVEFGIDYTFRGALDMMQEERKTTPVIHLPTGNGHSGGTETVMTMLLAMMENQQKTQIAMLNNVAQVMAAAVNRPADNSLTQVLIELLREHGRSSVSELMELMEAAREMQSRNDGGGLGEVLGLLASTVLPRLLPGVPQRALPEPSASAPAASAPAASAPAAPDTPPVAPAAPASGLLDFVFNRLRQAIGDGEEPEEFAYALAVLLGDDGLRELAPLIEPEDWLERLAALTASLTAEETAWLRRMRDELLKELRDEND